MRRLIQILEVSEIVIVPTDKTNRFTSMRKEKYKTMVKEHLKQSAREMDRGRVTEIFENAKVLVDSIGFRMSKNEVGHINGSLKKSYPNTQTLDQIPQVIDNYGRLPN